VVKLNATHRCIDCDDYYCEHDKTLHLKVKVSKTHKKFESLPDLEVKSTEKCPNHPKSDLEYQCEEDKELVCTHCISKKHSSHKWKLLSEIYEEEEKELKLSEEQIREQIFSKWKKYYQS
jgi:hypothetical protein